MSSRHQPTSIRGIRHSPENTSFSSPAPDELVLADSTGLPSVHKAHHYVVLRTAKYLAKIKRPCGLYAPGRAPAYHPTRLATSARYPSVPTELPHSHGGRAWRSHAALPTLPVRCDYYSFFRIKKGKTKTRITRSCGRTDQQCIC